MAFIMPFAMRFFPWEFDGTGFQYYGDFFVGGALFFALQLRH